jgi:EAL domain-containing protein (putative c-di-GMP-specific phosphodiesterase class I)
VTAPIHHDKRTLAVGLSVGVAVAPGDGHTPDELLRCADVALYRSKGNGRGSYSFFAADANERIAATRHLAEDMRHGIKAGQFFLEYQPRFNARTRKIQSVEALVRWTHPERGRIEPSDFIPVAEKSGLIVPLGEWVLRAACQAALAWPDIGVSVNISPVQFRGTDLAETIDAVLAETGLLPERLELEITEGVLLEDEERAHAVLDALKARGVRLAMDDFGTGYSSLNFLRGFPFDTIKIGRRFISDLEGHEGGRAIVQAILGLGKALGMAVTAQGVETAGQLLRLSLDECLAVQGFLLARPGSAAEVSALLKQAEPLGAAMA